MAAAYSLQLVSFQIMNYTYIVRSLMGCSVPTAWSVGARTIVNYRVIVYLYLNLYLYTVSTKKILQYRE